VAVDASETRQRLIAAAEHAFAEHGVRTAQLRDITHAAGQANDSAIHYHFGSRDGLVAAICAKHVVAMEAERRAMLDGLIATGRTAELTAVVEALVVPTARLLESADGRDFLQIMAQLAGRLGADDAVPDLLSGTTLQELLSLQRSICCAMMPAAVAAVRIEVAIGMFTTALADRARRVAHQDRVRMTERDFVANLVAMWTAALEAPWPAHSPTARKRPKAPPE
jgi:AcrR family transcriptional regulator